MRSGVGGAIPSCSCGAAVPCRRLYKPRNPGVAARFVELATIGVHTDLTCFFGAYAARRERSLAMSAHESFSTPSTSFAFAIRNSLCTSLSNAKNISSYGKLPYMHYKTTDYTIGRDTIHYQQLPAHRRHDAILHY